MAALRILVTGSIGFLGGHAAAAVRAAGHVLLTTARSGGDAAVDLTAPGIAAALAQALRPDVVLHLAALARLDDCERDDARARAVNATAVGALAERFGARLLAVSTDLVFDGGRAPYAAFDAPSPLSAYGRSKVAGEDAARAHGARIARLPLLFGPDARGRGASASLRAALAAGQPARLYVNEYRTPLHAADAARALVALVADPAGPGLLHLAGPERLSRWEFGCRFAARHGLRADLLQPVECMDPLRPRDVSLVGDLPPARDLDAMLADA
ncbi:MAG: sugar nucleotide-binding protein [Planctomycetes bacterium]|nr:sugar nucleotide-binding protein [Planctomycetota bacterium]